MINNNKGSVAFDAFKCFFCDSIKEILQLKFVLYIYLCINYFFYCILKQVLS